MKQFKNLLLVLPAALLMTTSCSETQEEQIESTADTIGNRVERTVDDLQDDFEDYKDNVFVANVIEENDEELELLKMGMQKGGADVKATAEELMKTHERLAGNFKDYAQQHTIDYRVRNNDTELEGMNAGAEWDEEWYDEVEDSQEKLVRMFERKRNKANDASLDNMVKSNLPSLQEDLNMLEGIESRHDDMEDEKNEM